MASRSGPAAIICSVCSLSVPLPEDDYRAASAVRQGLWELGWRWRGAPERPGVAGFVPRRFLFFCPVHARALAA